MLTAPQCVRLKLHKARDNCVYFEHVYCANRSRSSPAETNATETVGTGERPLYTGISREVGVHGINYLRYDLHALYGAACTRVVASRARRKLGGDDQAGRSRGTKSWKVAR